MKNIKKKVMLSAFFGMMAVISVAQEEARFELDNTIEKVEKVDVGSFSSMSVAVPIKVRMDVFTDTEAGTTIKTIKLTAPKDKNKGTESTYLEQKEVEDILKFLKKIQSVSKTKPTVETSYNYRTKYGFQITTYFKLTGVEKGRWMTILQIGDRDKKRTLNYIGLAKGIAKFQILMTKAHDKLTD